MLIIIAAFVLAIAILIAVHEWGHYAMAVASGVKVLRFSIGFGPRLCGWTSAWTGTEFVLCLLPLGGYVKMLDGREGVVKPEERHRAFDVQPLRKRAAIVAAGPLANLLLAVVLYCVVHWTGSIQLAAVLPRPLAGSMAAQAGFVGGERVLAAGTEADSLQAVRSFEDFRWCVTQAALARMRLVVEYQAAEAASTGTAVRQKIMTLEGPDTRGVDAGMFRAIGWLGPLSPAVLGDIIPGGAAAQAGLERGDRVMQVNGIDIVDAVQLRELIRAAGEENALAAQRWQVYRGDRLLALSVLPRREHVDGQMVGRVHAMVGAAPATVIVQYGVWDGLGRAVVKTWEVSALTLQMMGKMLVGEASLKNLSGPLAIADYAGKSAAAGWSPYLVFLALISISLGVLNLLPIPVLDGGHLMYYLWESLTGRPVTQACMAHLQRIGLGLLLIMMSIAVFNDVAHWLG